MSREELDPQIGEPVWSVGGAEYVIAKVIEKAGEQDGVTYWRVRADDQQGHRPLMVAYLSDNKAEWLEATTTIDFTKRLAAKENGSV